MFKGIVEATGLIRDIEDLESMRRFRVEVPALGPELAEGDSVAVDGACLTVTEADENGFAVEVIGTTLARTIAGGYGEGTMVNLERALLMGDRIDGHLVQGHVDGIGQLVQSSSSGEFWTMDFRLPKPVVAQTIERGSVALNGVSLTVADLLGPDMCRIGVIPYTHEHTNLGSLKPGDALNVEGDLIGKYVGRLMADRQQLGS